MLPDSWLQPEPLQDSQPAVTVDNTVLPTWAGMHVGVDVGVQVGPADVAPTCGAEVLDETLVDALETPVKALVDAADALGDASDAAETPEAKGTP